MDVMSWTFAVFYHIRFAEVKGEGDVTFGRSFMVAFQYFMSFEQKTEFLKNTDEFDIFPTSVVFFLVISCVSLLFNNLATGLMQDIRDKRKKQWGQHHSDMQLSELASIVEDSG